jgi:hypothetical protein
LKTSKRALFKTLLKEVWRIFHFWTGGTADTLMKTKKVDKRSSYSMLTVLAAFQPGGAHHQGPRQAHEDPGAGVEY